MGINCADLSPFFINLHFLNHTLALNPNLKSIFSFNSKNWSGKVSPRTVK